MFRINNQSDLDRWNVDDDAVHQVSMEDLIQMEAPEFIVMSTVRFQRQETAAKDFESTANPRIDRLPRLTCDGVNLA